MEKIIEKIKKIKELADNGLMGEAITAKQKLKEILTKYGLTIEDIEKSETKLRKFKYKGIWLKRIALQTIISVCSRKIEFFTSSRYPGFVLAELTDLEYIDACQKYDFHKKLFDKEKRKAEKMFFQAYIHKHKLFGIENEDSKSKELMKEEIAAILSIIENLDDVCYYKKLK